MAIDWSKFSDSELEAISKGDMQSLSDDTLMRLSGEQPQVSKPKDTLLPALNESLVKRSVNIADRLAPQGDESIGQTLVHAPGRALGVAGQVAGLGTDVIGNVLSDFYKTMTPQRFQDATSKAFSETMQQPGTQQFIKGVSGALDTAKQEFPRGYDIVGSLANIAGLPVAWKSLASAPSIAAKGAAAVGKGIETTAKGIATGAEAVGNVVKPILKEPGNVLGDVSAALKATTNKDVNDKAVKLVKDLYMPAIRPLDKKVGYTAKAQQQHAEKVALAEKDIVANRNSVDAEGNRLLNFYDNNGKPTKNNLPASAENHLEAIGIGKHHVLNDTIKTMESLDSAGSKLDPQPIVDFLKDLKIRKKASLVSDKTTVKYIDNTIEEYSKYDLEGIPLKTAYDSLTELNGKLRNAGNNVGYKEGGMKEVDMFVATRLRSGINDTIEKAAIGDPMFSKKRKLLGSYIAIEEDAAKAASRIAKKPKYSLFTESDIWMGYHTGVGILTGSAAPVIAAGMAKGVKGMLVNWHHPDNQIKRMYQGIYFAIDQSERAINPKSKFGQGFQKGMADRSENAAPEVNNRLRDMLNKRK